MKKILTMFVAVSAIFLATTVQAQNRDLNKADRYPSKEMRKNGDFRRGTHEKFDRKKDSKRDRREWRRMHNGKKGHMHGRHHRHGKFHRHPGLS